MADLRWISKVAYARTRVNFSRVNKTEAMYGRSHMKVKLNLAEILRDAWPLFIHWVYIEPLLKHSNLSVRTTSKKVKVVKAHRKLEKK